MINFFKNPYVTTISLFAIYAVSTRRFIHKQRYPSLLEMLPERASHRDELLDESAHKDKQN